MRAANTDSQRGAESKATLGEMRYDTNDTKQHRGTVSDTNGEVKMLCYLRNEILHNQLSSSENHIPDGPMPLLPTQVF